MTLAQLQALYLGSHGVGHLEGLEAVYAAGYADGKGQSVTAQTQAAGIVGSRPAPAGIPTLKAPDLR
jgi:hypothetical protein